MTQGMSLIKRLLKRSSRKYFSVSKKTMEIVGRIEYIIKDGHAFGPVDAAKWYYQRLNDRGHDLLPVENDDYSEFIAAIVVCLIQQDSGYRLDINHQKRVQCSVISELQGIHKNHIML